MTFPDNFAKFRANFMRICKKNMFKKLQIFLELFGAAVHFVAANKGRRALNINTYRGTEITIF